MSLASVVCALRPSAITAGVLRPAAVVGCATVAVKLAAMSKEVAVAACFGRGDLVDAFLLAYLVPGFLVVLFASSLNAALMPTLARARQLRGGEAADRLFSHAVLTAQAGLGLLCLTLAAFGPVLLRHLAFRFPSGKFLLTEHLFWAMLPTALLTGLATNCAAYLNVLGCFAVPALTPIASPVLTFLFLLTHSSDWGVWSLVAGVITGSFCEVLILMAMLYRHGYRLRLGLRSHPDSASVRRQYLVVCAAALLASGAGVLDQSMATLLPPGSVAALAYGGRIVGTVVALVASSVSTALLPYYSDALARNDWQACRHSMRNVSRLLFAVTIPVAICLVAGSGALVRVVYQHGAFTAADAALVARVQAMYALQLPFYGVAPVYLRFLVALQRNDLIMISAGVNLALDFILNLICMRWLGVAGLALSTSLFYAASFLLLRFWARRLLFQREQQAALGFPPPAAVTA